jgi:hypothetical protein
LAAKLMADDLGGGHYPEAAGWLALAAFAGVAATITGMTALQRQRSRTRSVSGLAAETGQPV